MHLPVRSPASASLRDPRPADYAALSTWVSDAASCVRWAGPMLPFPFEAAQLPQLLKVSELSQSISRVLSIGESGDALAFGQFWVRDAGAVHLGRLIVAPSARGLGLGRQLCDVLMAEAIGATGASSVSLRVWRDNLAALSLYTTLGFEPEAATSDDEVLAMRKTLAVSQ